MSPHQYLSQSEEHTIKIAQRLSTFLKGGDIVCLYGDLGSGKTTFVKGIASGIKINPNNVHSPTFVLLNIYEGALPLYHFDFYRLNREQEVAAIGYEEFLYGEGLSVIEWPNRFGSLLPKEFLGITFFHKGEDERLLRFHTRGERYKNILKNFQQVGKTKCIS